MVAYEGICCAESFGVLFVRKEYKNKIDQTLLNHELIHTRQIVEMAFVPFYLWYGAEYVVRLCQFRNRRAAYYNISMEREAYRHGDDLTYLKQRKPYAWWAYLKNKQR